MGADPAPAIQKWAEHDRITVTGFVDDPAPMADRVAALLEGDQWQRLSDNGRRFVLNNFTWQKGVEKLERILADVTREAAS